MGRKVKIGIIQQHSVLGDVKKYRKSSRDDR